jgi:hypothetical protein
MLPARSWRAPQAAPSPLVFVVWARKETSKTQVEGLPTAGSAQTYWRADMSLLPKRDSPATTK